MKRFLMTIGAAATFLAVTGLAQGQVTSTNSISLQAKLEGVTGSTANLIVKFYDAVTGGAQVGSAITLSNVPVSSGIVSVPVSPVDPTVFNGTIRYMGLSINGGNELSPRTLITSVPYAVKASTILDDRGYGILANSQGTARLGINTTPNALLHVQQFVQDPSALYVEGNLQNEPASPVVVFTFRDEDQHPIIQTGGISFLEKHGDTQHRLIKAFYNDGVKLELENNGNLWVAGNFSATSVTIRGGSDVAEPVGVTPTPELAKAEPGMVMVIDPNHDGKLVPCSTAYDKAVAGVLSGANGLKPGMVLSAEGQAHTAAGDDTMPLAMTGRVWVWCDASYSPIGRGDALTTSATPGHAMAVSDEARANRTVIGKAMSELKEGKGLVLVLVNLQ